MAQMNEYCTDITHPAHGSLRTECPSCSPKLATQPASGVSANDVQYGGDHYRKRAVQHWDWVCDNRIHYLLGCATKYVSRWRDKNGVEDLQKSIHYLEKAKERQILPPGIITMDFVDQHEPGERAVLVDIINGQYDAAIRRLHLLMNGLS